ncbi:hypothetical protein JX265_006473 [Neoarthrinium moseri]|uniref:Uncharacterized protein n=1 Tax=Neoarthrinium moseri TaxID=1658444 RepID=A0A9P9WLT0_9PEZI|nr:hypothetical protein JX265_006473 [Neoarthrinium moseri]
MGWAANGMVVSRPMRQHYRIANTLRTPQSTSPLITLFGRTELRSDRNFTKVLHKKVFLFPLSVVVGLGGVRRHVSLLFPGLKWEEMKTGEMWECSEVRPVVGIRPDVENLWFMLSLGDISAGFGVAILGGASRQEILAVNVLCFFPARGMTFSPEGRSQLILSWGIIVGATIGVAALAAATMLLERPTGILKRCCEHYRGEMLEYFSGTQQTCPRCEQRFILLVIRPFVAFWLMLRAYSDLLSSVCFEVTCIASLLLWILVRMYELLNLQSFEVTGSGFGFAHFLAFVTLLAPLKPCVEHLWRNCDGCRGVVSPWRWARFRAPKRASLPTPAADEGDEDGHTSYKPDILSASAGTVTTQDDIPSKRRKASTTPLRFKFYLDTPWYARALPIYGGSVLSQLVIMLALTAIGSKPPVEVVTLLLPWCLAFAPVQILLFNLAAMIVEEKGRSTQGKDVAYWVLSALFGVISIGAALDTVVGIGGFPVSYIGMATLSVTVIAYVLYGCVSKPGHLAKGKATSRGDVDEEAALIGSKTQARIPVRRPKRLHGPSRRLGKQKITNYGTMV